MEPLRILIASTPVGPLGSGIGGGVELTLHSLVLGLSGRGHHVEVVAPAGSLHVGARTHQIPGALQRSSQIDARDAPASMPSGSVLGAMWEWIRAHGVDHDIVINLAFDWLPMYLTRFLDVPVAHVVSMASVNDSIDLAISQLLAARPGSVAMHSAAQAASYGPDIEAGVRLIGNGLAPERYEVHLAADEPGHLGFVGRISPEKGIADVFAVAARAGMPVRVWGLMQDEECWRAAAAAHPTAAVTYEGFLATDDLQAVIGGCRAIIMTPKWVEAFGNVAMESLACGVPVIAYRRGGPAEIITDGETGFLVEPDDIDGLVGAVGRLDEIDRLVCRQRAEERFSTDALAARVEAWLAEVMADVRTTAR